MSTIGQVLSSRAAAKFGAVPTLQPIPGGVTIATDNDPDNPVAVTCEQSAPALWRPPRGRWSTIDRGQRIGLLSYDGQDPYELLLSVRLDGFPGTSMEPAIAVLEGFAEVPDGEREPPILTVNGAIPKPHPNLKWRMTQIDDPTDLLFLADGKSRCRYSTTVTLTQHVTAGTLTESLKLTKASRGLQTRTTRVKPSEASLYDVARRYYHDPSRASDIATANFLTLGGKLKAGTKLRMPV